MATATFTSISNFSQPLSLENTSNNLRDVSFSFYSSTGKETFAQKFASSNTEEHRKKKDEDGEIGVFGAEKYFNGAIDEDSPRLAKNIVPRKTQYKKDEKDGVLVVPVKPKVHPKTPSVQSESSWNSQSALLQSSKRIPSRNRTNKIQRKGFLAVFGCSCSDKDSVDAEEHVGEISFKKSPKAIAEDYVKASLDLENKSQSGSWRKEEIQSKNLDLVVGLSKEACISFPNMNSMPGNVSIRLPIQEHEDLNCRKSLEVFGSPVQDRRNKSTVSLDKRLTMLSWDAKPRVAEIQLSATSGAGYDDNESDASSDLFEIESLAGKVNPFLARQGSDAASGCVTPNYAPSEASIEWSVVTASAADFSVMSDYEELRPPMTIRSPRKMFPANTNAKTGLNKGSPKRRPSSLLGCTSQKAVNVAGDAYRTNEREHLDSRMYRDSESYMPVARFPAEAKLTGFETRPGHSSLSTQSLPRPHLPHSSHLLYIQ